MLPPAETASQGAPAQPVLSARGVGKTYATGGLAVVALEAVDLDIAPGTIVAVVGPSGSGKSTLLHVLSGIDAPSHGAVDVSGRRLSTMTDGEAATWRARHFGFVLQRDNLIPSLTLRENVAAPMLLAGRAWSASFRRADAALERVGLGERGHALPAHVSGGEAQRAAVARACAGRPLLVFADEPTGALDQTAGASVVALFQDVVRETNAAAVVVTHEARVAAIADVVLEIEDGRIRARRAVAQPSSR